MQCPNSVAQYPNSVAQCPNSVVQCPNSVAQSPNGVAQCPKSVAHCRLLFGKGLLYTRDGPTQLLLQQKSRMPLAGLVYFN